MKKTANTNELASILGVTPRTLSDLIKRGIIARSGRDFAFPEAAQKYCAHLRALATGRGGEGAIASATTERARLLRGQADAVEFRNSVQRREMLPAAEVEAGWSSILRTVRSGILAAPSRIAQRLPHLSAHDVAEIDAELRAVLAQLGGADA